MESSVVGNGEAVARQESHEEAKKGQERTDKTKQTIERKEERKENGRFSSAPLTSTCLYQEA